MEGGTQRNQEQNVMAMLSVEEVAVADFHFDMERVDQGVLRLEQCVLDGMVLEGRFVEVKGPRDTLMSRQKAWLGVLGEAAVDRESKCSVEVCHVVERTWSEKKKKKKTSKTNEKM